MTNILKLSTFIFVCFLCFEVKAQKNVLKHNVYGHLNFIEGVKTYGLSYERAVKEKFSWSISASYGTFRRDQTSVVSTGTTEKLSFTGFDIIPEVRWYIFSNEYKTAPMGFFLGPYAKIMFLEEEYARLVSEEFDVLAQEQGWLGGLGFATGYKLGTDPITFEILGGFAWGIESGFIGSEVIDPLFSRINKRFMLSRLEFSVGFIF